MTPRRRTRKAWLRQSRRTWPLLLRRCVGHASLAVRCQPLARSIKVPVRTLPMLMRPARGDEPATFVGVLPDEVSVTVTKTDGTEAQVIRSGNAFWVTGPSLGSLIVHTKTAGDKTVFTVGPRTLPPIPPSPFTR